MTTAVQEPKRRYRLAPQDETGLMFGRTMPQLLIAAAGVVIGAVLLLTAGFVPGLIVGGVLVGFGMTSIDGKPLIEWIGHGTNYVRFAKQSSTEWFSVVPLLGGTDEISAPGPLVDHDLLVVDAGVFGVGPAGQKIAVSRDRRGNTLAATIKVTGRQFSLLEEGEQDWLISQWGTALQAFIADRTAVASIRWSEWAAPAGLEEHRRWIDEHRTANPLKSIRESYEALLREGGASASRHEVLVTVTVATKKVNIRKRHNKDQEKAAIELLLDETSMFTRRLTGAALQVSAPLSPSAWARVMRLRLDPKCRLGLDVRRQTLGEEAGGVNPKNAAPLSATHRWDSWQTDGGWHRSLYVADWPRLDVPAAWMSQLMLWSGSVRTISAFFEPVPRSKSFTQITRAAGKIQSDEDSRRKDGWRVGAHHRRAKQAVDEREEELVAGYGEFNYAGVVVVSAESEEALETAADEITQVAAGIGIDLRPLHGRHDQAVCATLPLARALAPKKVF